MADIIKQELFPDKSCTDSADYFQAVLEYALWHGLLSENEAVFLQRQLFSLMEKQTRRYTQGDSSSLPEEASRSLLQSVCYCIGIYLKQAPDDQAAIGYIKHESLESLMNKGAEVVEKLTRKGKLLLHALQASALPIDNITYREAIDKGIPLFFQSYDIRFAAHETPCDIDYWLCNEVTGLNGIEYMLAYMRRLQMENLFCAQFKPYRIERLMQSVCRDSHAVPVNIFEPVFFNSMGLALIHANIRVLNITPYDKSSLFDTLKNLSDAALNDCINNAANNICAEFEIQSAEFIAYIKEAQTHLFDRLKQQLKAGDLDALFITFAEEPAPALPAYNDGAPMPDEDLRELIDALTNCGQIEDKIAMIKREIHSLADLMEVTAECFCTGERVHVFKLLNDMEYSVILKHLYDLKGDLLFERISNGDWENEFLDYLEELPVKRREWIFHRYR